MNIVVIFLKLFNHVKMFPTYLYGHFNSNIVVIVFGKISVSYWYFSVDKVRNIVEILFIIVLTVKT